MTPQRVGAEAIRQSPEDERRMIIDARAQHPTLRHARDPMFDSLRRWNRQDPPAEELPVRATIRAMDQAGVAKSLIGLDD